MLGKLLKGRQRRVAVLGAGPAGLLAAQGAYERGYEPVIYSRPELGERDKVAKSELHGCQYLHAPVPSPALAGPTKRVNYTLRGTSDGYRTKVYGPESMVAVSPDEYGQGEPHRAWDLREVYERLWHRWHLAMRPKDLTAGEMRFILAQEWAAVLVTVPAPVLCWDPTHQFSAQSIWAMGQRIGDASFPFTCPEFTVVCNGERDTGWYRIANVFGYTTVEWATSKKPPLRGVVRVEKPLTTNCACHLDDKRVHRLGRFGKWEKGILVHTAYTEAKEILK